MNKIEIEERLIDFRDEKYKEFHCNLMPGYDKERVIGVRMPKLRAFAKEIARDGADEFIDNLPHFYYEENNLHGLIICNIKDYDEVIARLEDFLPYVDNWATCDLLKPIAFKKNHDRAIADILRWVSSDKTYTIRFGIGMLMTFYLDDYFKTEYLDTVASVDSDEYYVNMMRAWYFATALAKQYEATIPFIEERKLDKWTHAKTIQKAIESYRISDDTKNYLRSLK